MSELPEAAPPVEILIVEDSPTQAQRLRHILEEAGYRVTGLPDGRQAIEAATRRKPALIISDINMPVMDGFEFCARVKADDELAEIPVILSTTLADSKYLLRCLECNADNFIAKPYEADYLLSRVRHALLNSGACRPAPSAAAVEMAVDDRRYRITAGREQILNLLFSSYAAAEQRNKELRLAQQHLINEREAAESSNQAKSLFLAMMSHELRTPLNGILGMNDLLLQTELTGRQRRFVEACSASGKALLQQINDVLDLSKIEAGKLELDVRPCRLDSLVREVVQVFEHSAVQKGISLECFVDAAAAIAVRADDARLRQVLLNLLGNAIKFTSAGGVTVRVEVASRPDGRLAMRLSVADTGLGIPEDRQERLFAPFSQVHQSTSRHFGGTGLGLSICKQLVELMKGRIGVESRLGSGATFWFEVDLEIAPERAASADAARPDAGGGAARPPAAPFAGRVLVAEDNPINQLYIIELLEHFGCRSDLVANGAEAVETLAQRPYDLVLMDCQMPEMDGFAASREIRRREAAGMLPARSRIVALTANAIQGDRQRCLDAGMDDYVSKPVERAELQAVLEKYLRRAPRAASAP